jgi:hypothetical protein
MPHCRNQQASPPVALLYRDAFIPPGPRNPCMKLVVERADPPEGAGACAVGCRAAEHHSDPLQRAAVCRRRCAKLMATDLDLQIVEDVPRDRGDGRRDHRERPTPCSTSFARCPMARRSRWRPPGQKMAVTAGRARFQPADAAARGFPGDRRKRPAGQLHAASRNAGDADRQDPFRDLHRRDALLSERHLLPRARRRRHVARGCDRRPPPRPRRNPAARGR